MIKVLQLLSVGAFMSALLYTFRFQKFSKVFVSVRLQDDTNTVYQTPAIAWYKTNNTSDQIVVDSPSENAMIVDTDAVASDAKGNSSSMRSAKLFQKQVVQSQQQQQKEQPAPAPAPAPPPPSKPQKKGPNKPERRDLKVPKPIFVLNLPKSGTGTIHGYFSCGVTLGNWINHHQMRNATGHVYKVGECMHKNDRAGKPMVDGCGGYAVFTDAGAMYKDKTRNPQQQCFYPAVHGLENIAKHYPNSTIMHLKRNTTSWIRSARKWGNILKRMSNACIGAGGFPQPDHDTDEEWATFYEQMTIDIRNFAEAHPSLTYIEHELEAPDIGQFLESKTGITSACWSHQHKSKK